MRNCLRLILFLLTACSHQSKERQWLDSLAALEQAQYPYEELGEPQAVIPFGVITNDRKIFVDGIVLGRA